MSRAEMKYNTSELCFFQELKGNIINIFTVDISALNICTSIAACKHLLSIQYSKCNLGAEYDLYRGQIKNSI